MRYKAWFVFLLTLLPAAAQAQPKSPRLYIFDCGTLKIADPSRYRVTPADLATTDMSDPCFLIVHPKGTMMWDVGVIPDGGPLTKDYGTAFATVPKPLLPQLAQVGYKPADITYLALSHFHYDHVANANTFAGSTWLTPQAERDYMFINPPAGRTVPEYYQALKNSKTVIIKDDEYDVFGDKTVVIKAAPGHSPGHQVLMLRLAKTGPLMLSGDLYHYPEERALGRLPVTDFNPEQTGTSRKMIEAYLKKTGAKFWIQHDFIGNGKLKKAPDFYE